MRELESRVQILAWRTVDSSIEIPIEDEEIEAEAVRPRQLLLDGAGVVIAPTALGLEILIGTSDELLEMIAVERSGPAVEVISAEARLRLRRSCSRSGENARDINRQRR